MPSIPSYDQPLPLCEGPKLHPFPKGKVDITFKRLLQNDQDSSDSSYEEGRAHVFEVSIDSKTYALKVVRVCVYIRLIPEWLTLAGYHSSNSSMRTRTCQIWTKKSTAGSAARFCTLIWTHFTKNAERTDDSLRPS